MKQDIRLRETGEVVTDYEYRLLHPTTSFMDDFIPEDGDRILDTEAPALTAGQKAARGALIEDEGVWRYEWVIVKDVPQNVSMRQARLALLQANKLNLVDQAIESMESPFKEQAKIEWEYSQDVDRNVGLVSMMGPLLGLTDEDIDDLFILAYTL